jgi:hypothetical protein
LKGEEEEELASRCSGKKKEGRRKRCVEDNDTLDGVRCSRAWDPVEKKKVSMYSLLAH